MKRKNIEWTQEEIDYISRHAIANPNGTGGVKYIARNMQRELGSSIKRGEPQITNMINSLLIQNSTSSQTLISPSSSKVLPRRRITNSQNNNEVTTSTSLIQPIENNESENETTQTPEIQNPKFKIHKFKTHNF